MTTEVSDKFSNFNDNLAHAAKILAGSNDRRKVFGAIYKGKKNPKFQEDIQKATKLSRIRVLQLTGTLHANGLIGREKVDGFFAYKKLTFYVHHRNKVLSLANSRVKLASLPTKVNPNGLRGRTISIKIPSKAFNVANITVDEIDSFSKVKKVRQNQAMKPIAEDKFKQGIKKIIGEGGKFTDWGGEKNDLFTTKVRLKGKRLPAAFAFKGKGKKGVLKPKDFGKNGDQIQRLFQSDAQLIMLQYWHQLDQSVYEQMKAFAIAKSALTGEKIYFGVIDGQDTQRLKIAYPTRFR